MKLRIRDNSLRFRLAQGEVEALHARGAVRAQCVFPGGRRFSYSVEAGGGSAAAASLEADGIRVQVPKADVSRWSVGEDVSLLYDVVTKPSGSLRILVEKDFACLAPRADEDESDLFPHPQAGKSTC